MDTYLNIGSIENFREYYTTYAEVAIGEYEHWEEEEWVDAANPDWQKFIGQLDVCQISFPSLSIIFSTSSRAWFSSPASVG